MCISYSVSHWCNYLRKRIGVICVSETILTERYFLVHEHQGLFEGLRSESASDVFFLADPLITAEG